MHDMSILLHIFLPKNAHVIVPLRTPYARLFSWTLESVTSDTFGGTAFLSREKTPLICTDMRANNSLTRGMPELSVGLILVKCLEVHAAESDLNASFLVFAGARVMHFLFFLLEPTCGQKKNYCV